MGSLAFEVFLILIQIALFAAVAVFLFRMFIWIISGNLDAPFVPTPRRYAEIVAVTLDVMPGDIVFELGSGDGKFALALAVAAPQTRFIGIERNPLLYATALVYKWRVGNPSNIEFRRGNFFKADFSEATKVYAYLLDTVMFRLRPKFEKEFRGRLASRAFPIPGRELSNVIALTEKIGAHGQHLLFVYDF